MAILATMSTRPHSDFNLKTISTVDYAKVLAATIGYGGNCFTVGRRGSGKTQIANKVINDSDCDLFFWNLSTMERVDASGFPDIASPSREDEYVRYILPVIFKPLLEGNRPVVALLDEVDKADKELHAPLLEFLQFKSINGRKFKNLRSVIMTGNLPSEGGRRPILPLLDRTEKYLLEPTAKHWIEWGAMAGKIHPTCLAFLNDYPAELSGDVNPGENYGDSSPRMWEEASNIVKYGEKNGWGPDLITMKIAGCLGKSTGIKYQTYFDYYQVLLPDIQAVLSGKKVKGFFDSGMHPGKKITAILILCTRVAALLDKMEEDKSIELPVEVHHLGKFLSEIDPEMALLGIRSGFGKERARKHLFKIKTYDTILEKLAQQVKAS